MTRRRLLLNNQRKSDDGLWGILDDGGEWMLEPISEMSLTYSEGRVRCRVGGLFGFLDMYGAWVVPPLFRFADHYAHGTTRVW